MPFVSWWIWVIYPAGCFTFWLIASSWCHVTCPSVPRVSWKPGRSRGLTSHIWCLARSLRGWRCARRVASHPHVQPSLLWRCYDWSVAHPALPNELPTPFSISIAVRTCFAKQVSWEHRSYRTARSDGKCTDLKHRAQIRGFISLHLSFLDCRWG